METTDTKRIELRKSDVVKSFARWQWAHIANYNYERMQASGVVWALSPVLRRLYGDNKEEMIGALERHMNFFNTEPSFGGPIISTTIAMEEQRANGVEIQDSMIDGFKTGLMGPLAGIGDTLWQGTITPILLSFTIPFAAEGNIFMGPVAFWVLQEAIMLLIAYNLWMIGYKTGKDGIQKLLQGSLLQNVMTFCQTLGPIVMGALTFSFVTVSTPFKLALGKGEYMSIQEGVLDKLMPGLLPLVVTLLTYLALKKKLKTGTILLILIVGGALLAIIGILSV